METIYVLIKVGTGHLEQVVEMVKTLKGIGHVDIVTGTYDIVVTITGDDIASMLSQVVDDVRSLDGIKSTETLIALNID